MQATNRLSSPHYDCSAASRAPPIDCSSIDYAGSRALVSVRCLPQDDQQTRMPEPMPPAPRVPIVECRRQLLTWFSSSHRFCVKGHYYGTRKLRLPRKSFSCDSQRLPFISPGAQWQPGEAHKSAAGIHPHEKRNLIVVDGSYLNAMLIDFHLHATLGTRRPCDNCLFVCLFVLLPLRAEFAAALCQRRDKSHPSFEFIERWHTRHRRVVETSRSASLARCRRPLMREPMFLLHHP
jgi:hypothetical protein